MKLNELIEEYGDYEISDLEKFKDSIAKPKTVWDLKDGDTYYDISSNYIDRFIWSEDCHDETSRCFSNVFLTAEEAEKELKRRKVGTLLKKHAKGHKFEYNKNNFYIGYEHREKRIFIYWDPYIRLGGEVYFASYEDAEKAIEKIGKDRLIREYFQIEEESKDGGL